MRLLHADVGHQNTISSLAFSPDGRRILSGSDDGTAKLWDVATGAILHTLDWGAERVNGVAWSPDGKLLAIAGDSPPRTWTAEELRRRQQRESSPADGGNSVAGSPDQVRLFDAESGGLLRIIDDAGQGVAFSPDGRVLAVISIVSIAVINLAEITDPVRSQNDDWDLRRVVYSCDGQLVAAIGTFGVCVFDAQTAELVRIESDPQLFASAETSIDEAADGSASFLDPADVPAAMTRFWQQRLPEFGPASFSDNSGSSRIFAFSVDGKYMAATAYECRPRPGLDQQGILILRTNDCIVERVLIMDDSQSLAYRMWQDATFSPDGCTVAVAGNNQRIVLWDVESGRGILRIGSPPAAITTIAVAPLQPYLATGSSDGMVCLLNSASLDLLGTVQSADESIAQIAFSPDENRLLIAEQGGRIRIVSVPTLRLLGEIPAHALRYIGGAFSPDGTRLVTVGYRPLEHRDRVWTTELTEWSVPDGQRLQGHELGENIHVTSVATSADRRQMAISTFRTIWLVEIAEGLGIPDACPPLERQPGGIHVVTFAPDGDSLLIACEGYAIGRMDLANRSCQGYFNSTLAIPRSMAITSDGKYLVRASSVFNEIELFEAGAGRLLKYFIGHQNAVRSVVISPDGHSLLSGSSDGTLKVWDIESGRLLRSLIPTRQPLLNGSD